jgi:hypothetical protein
LTRRRGAGNASRHELAFYSDDLSLLDQGNPEAAIHVEKLANQLVKEYDVDILCEYALGGRQVEI